MSGTEVQVVTATSLSILDEPSAEHHPVNSLRTQIQADAQAFELVDVQEPSRENDNSENDETAYPSGIRLWMAVISVCTVSILFGLDLTIVAATVPSLTNYFKTVSDIGWYSSAYSLVTASFALLSGKLYSISRPRGLFMTSIAIFELGSLLCTVATSSKMFIVGRAVAGAGAAGIITGNVVIITKCFPRHKRPFWTTVAGSAQLTGIVSAPLIGGALIDWVGWRGCFGINLPLGTAAVAMVHFGTRDLALGEGDGAQDWRTKLKEFDWLGTVLMLPAVSCLLLALQWGGSRFGWGDARIIFMVVLFVVLLAAFAWRQYRLQDNATLPPRILKMKTVLAAVWFGSCVNAALSVTEYYMSIYFQGVKGYSPSRAGLMLTPMLVGVVAGNLCGGAGINWLGWYNRECSTTIVFMPCCLRGVLTWSWPAFMIATTILAPVASGLLTTIDLDESLVKMLCLLGFLGFATGLGILCPIISMQTLLKQKDLPIGIAISGFGQTMSSAVWIVVSATLFQNRLAVELAEHDPSVIAMTLENAGLSEIRHVVGSARLHQVLTGYDTAIAQTLYLPLALTAATVFGSVFAEWRSVKKAQD